MPEMLTPDRERPIRKEDLAKLHTMLGLPETETIPQGVVDSYWQHIRLWQRLGYSGAASDALLVSIVVHGKATAPAPAAVPWLVKAVQEGSIKPDDRVKVQIGNKLREAKFICLAQGNDRARVHVDGSADEQLVAVQQVQGAV